MRFLPADEPNFQWFFRYNVIPAGALIGFFSTNTNAIDGGFATGARLHDLNLDNWRKRFCAGYTFQANCDRFISRDFRQRGARLGVEQNIRFRPINLNAAFSHIGDGESPLISAELIHNPHLLTITETKM